MLKEKQPKLLNKAGIFFELFMFMHKSQYKTADSKTQTPGLYNYDNKPV